MAQIMKSLLLLLLLPLYASAIHQRALQPFLDNGLSHTLLSFRLADDVAGLQTDFLSHAMRDSAKVLEGLRVAVKQTEISDQPPEWVLVDLIAPAPAPEGGAGAGEDEAAAGEVVATVAIRNDNFYVVAVTNDQEDWECLAGTEQLIPGCKRLSFDGRYNEDHGMIARDNLDKVELGRAAMVRAVYDFRGHRTDAPSATSEERMKIAMATVVVVISEAARFTEITDLLLAGWESTVFIKDPKKLVYWARISCALAKGWDVSSSEVQAIVKVFGLDESKSKEEAIGLLNVAIYGRACVLEIDALP